jgi:hypothetical protein
VICPGWPGAVALAGEALDLVKSVAGTREIAGMAIARQHLLAETAAAAA